MQLRTVQGRVRGRGWAGAGDRSAERAPQLLRAIAELRCAAHPHSATPAAPPPPQDVMQGVLLQSLPRRLRARGGARGGGAEARR